MGCHVTKNPNSDQKFREQVITDEMLQECKVDEDVKSRISVYNQALEKMQKIPKLRNASILRFIVVFNPIVQRRKMQKFDED
ncbi:unnamed protein product (macronuclear) [Paramecium tetraurelia]|uniref:Uncharacterized protein n=1 Tax=Paramecium tetraurelia TaxID=5888 RepID=A0DNY2_PARTE|nr:uncharacterized protein GSPATT00018945001 [Paramecium tetraurelia]CAK84749.1 unnamed protein product [Paramecium tetraurelia]|eukprot:XP_001452146.1 hypothetical protein (macronuclear) [Paramecium tetraurelia strain d4-2]